MGTGEEKKNEWFLGNSKKLAKIVCTCIVDEGIASLEQCYYFFQRLNCSLNTHDANALLSLSSEALVLCFLENFHSSLSTHSIAMK